MESALIDENGFRPNVGIILSNSDGKVFWGKRIGQRSWQFPQGGINEGESPLEAMYRELHEEIGLTEEHVEVVYFKRSVYEKALDELGPLLGNTNV